MRSGILLCFVILCAALAEGKVYTKCGLTQELLKKGFSRSLVGNWVCLIESESGKDTSKQETKANGSKSLGLFQINSKEWCQFGAAGGKCRMKCEAEGFPRCHRHDPEMEKCLLAATETVRPYVLTGVPDFIPGIQNFSIPRIAVKDGNEALNYKAELHNLTMYGLEEYKFNRYYYNSENGTFLINVQLPHLFLKGRYNLNGRIFFAPLKGNGDFHVNITDSSCAVFQTVDIVKKNGTDFMQPSKTLPKMRVGKIIDYEFDGLFEDNKELELLARQVIHENLMVIVDELLPTVEQVLGALFDELIFKSVTKIPYDKLYPK